MLEAFNGITDGVIVYVTMILAAAYLIATNVEKIGGVIYSIAEKRREATSAKQGADIASMKRQISHLTDAVESLQNQINEERREFASETERYRDTMLNFHTWAFDARTVATKAGFELPTPPSMTKE